MTTAAQYYESAKTEEYAEKLKSDGYSVLREARIDGVVFDLVATKDKEKLFFEFVFKKSPKAKSKQLVRMRQVAKKNGATEFRAIIFDVPKQIEVEIEWIDEVLNELMQSDEAEEQVVNLGNGCSIEWAYAGAITSIKMNNDGIRIGGIGEVDVEIFIGPSSEGASISDNFPFVYDITVDYEKKLQEVHAVILDDSSYYDNGDEEDEVADEEPEKEEEEE